MSAVERDVEGILRQCESYGKESGASGAAVRDSHPASESILRRVRRDVVFLGAGNVGIVVAQLCFRSILIAALPPASYGRLALVLSIYNTVWIIGASGIPSSVARHIALIAPADDSAVIRSAIRANVLPTVMAVIPVAVVSGILLRSALADLMAVAGFVSLVYTLLATGILRGRGRVVEAALVMPLAGMGEVLLLALSWRSGLGVSALSGFGIFCVGNVIGLAIAVICVARTKQRPSIEAQASVEGLRRPAPRSRELLRLSLWVGAATVGIAILPLILRFAAVSSSYSVVAMVDVALVLFTIPSRMGAIIVAAVIPHASRAVGRGGVNLKISKKEHIAVVVPFLCVAGIVALTPILGWIFHAIGRPSYVKSADYLALALLAGPARVLYGLVEGMLVAHDEGRFMAVNALSISGVASAIVIVVAMLGSMTGAFGVFVVAFWAIYLCGLRRIERLSHAQHAPIG